jgi:hypothetical protein
LLRKQNLNDQLEEVACDLRIHSGQSLISLPDMMSTIQTRRHWMSEDKLVIKITLATIDIHVLTTHFYFETYLTAPLDYFVAMIIL